MLDEAILRIAILDEAILRIAMLDEAILRIAMLDEAIRRIASPSIAVPPDRIIRRRQEWEDYPGHGLLHGHD